MFDLQERPSHLLVMGDGAIGVELAQAFARLGSRVTLVEAGLRILAKEEPEASRVLTAVLERDVVAIRAGVAVERVSAGPTLHLADGQTVPGSHLLVAVGLTPATDGMGLAEAGVAVGDHGEVVTDASLRTTAGHIYAAGDCTSPLQFTHVGDEQGRLAAANAFAPTSGLRSLVGGPRDFLSQGIPWVTFTDPEVGRSA